MVRGVETDPDNSVLIDPIDLTDPQMPVDDKKTIFKSKTNDVIMKYA